jgi:hypothetical protein
MSYQRRNTMAKSARRDDATIAKLETRAANLKLAKIKAQREFIDARGRTVRQEERPRIQKKRDMILFELELEGAEIERELVVAYRRRLSGLGFNFVGVEGLQTATGCPFCTTCITSCLECVTSCTACVACSNDVF